MTFVNYQGIVYESKDEMLKTFLASCLTPICGVCCTVDGLCEIDERYLAEKLKELKAVLGGEWNE